MKELNLFADGSLDPRTNTGYGAYLLIEDLQQDIDKLKAQVNLRRFTQTTSAKLELQTVLWALEEIPGTAKKIRVYTDSQNIISLPARRNKLEARGFRNKKNQLHLYHEWYRTFFRITSQLDCTFVKVAGHSPVLKKEDVDQIFTLVDRASRKALRNQKFMH